jgi:toxin ParE1/3/4
MAQYRIAAPARWQLAAILAVSLAEFGERRARNYRLLLTTAMEDVAVDPARPGAQRIRRYPGIMAYDIRHSKSRTPRGQRVRDPWHKLIYARAPDGVVEILAVVGRPYPSGRAVREGLALR